MPLKTLPEIHSLLKPVTHYSQALSQPGIYALWCQEGESKRLLSVRPSDDIRRSLEIHASLQTLRIHSGNRITFSVGYMPRSSAIERETLARFLSRHLSDETE
ncbi:hypothetical protein [Candidatus Avelusimicrobium aviculae]|uniref:hypothetical protein n=1 Tax=Candidatus Avelusimicrobium aviculae TaxID=3416206 RepID=UPI003D0F3950